jgi:hypothetical protein
MFIVPVEVFIIPLPLVTFPPVTLPMRVKAFGDALAKDTQVEEPATTLVVIMTPLLGLNVPPPPMPVAPTVLMDKAVIF